MKTLLSVVIFLVAASLAAQGATEPAGLHKRSITEKDLFDFVWVADPELSPDGTRVAFTRVSVDEKRTGYETSIWTAAANGNEAPVRMTNGKHDAQPRWSSDGKYLLLVRGGDKDETGKPKPLSSQCFHSPGEKLGRLRSCRKGPRTRSGRPTASGSPS